MNLSDYKFIKVAGINMKSLELDGVEIWRWAYENKVPLSINADGTIYNGGLGYKNGYRVRSGGAEAASGYATCTGFIPVKGGDVVRIKGWDRYTNSGATGNAINVADANFTNIGQVSNYRYGIFESAYAAYNETTINDGADGVSSWVVPPAASGVAYIRVTGQDQANGTPGAKLIVTINEEII